jgi:hypothetical protein
MSQHYHRQSLAEEARQVIEEARMVLPGIQAICGFQLVAVFNNRFDTALSGSEQMLHLAAFLLVAAAMALIMTPAAYARQVERGYVTAGFIRMASRLVTISMVPLALGLSIDTGLIAHMISHSISLSIAVAAALLAVFIALWFAMPMLSRRHRWPPVAPARPDIAG